MRGRPAATAVLIGAGLLVVGGVVFLRAPETEGIKNVPGEGSGSIVSALCRARDNAETDTAESRRIWLDEVHTPLHGLADEVATRDRAAAADLLEAKQAVEADLEEEVIDPDALERDLDDLIGATIAASEVLEVEGGSCA